MSKARIEPDYIKARAGGIGILGKRMLQMQWRIEGRSGHWHYAGTNDGCMKEFIRVYEKLGDIYGVL